MSGLDLALRNLGAWSAQAAVLGLVAAALARLAPVERPGARLLLYQALLALVLGLPLLQPWSLPEPAPSGWASVAREGPSAAVPVARLSPPVAPFWPPVLASLLALGAAFRLGRLAGGLLRLRSLRADARRLDAPPWLLALRDEVAPRASFLVAAGCGTPATFGVRRPVVLLPPEFEAMPRDRQAGVALHELIHARRRDWLALLLEELLQAVLFFHPAVHWLIGRIRLAREQAVDAEVVHRIGRREAYLESLLEAARLASSRGVVPAAPFLRESHLRERVDLLLKEVPMSAMRTLSHAGLTGLATLFAVSFASAALPLQSGQPAPATAPAENAAPKPASEPKGAPPKLVVKVNPVYPADARAERAEGQVSIDVVVAKDGKVQDARVVASALTSERLRELQAKKGTPEALEGDARLSAAALDAVRQWRYEPIVRGGQAVEFKLTITVAFRL